VLEKIETVSDLRARFASTASIALVPTMGALHAGHAALIKAARRDSRLVVVSIFVNPLQFDNQSDLSRYPRTLEADLALCRELGVEVVFVPSVEEVYREPPECSVDVGRLADHLCGKFRPGHFRGVATVVLKLFNIVRPHRAYFGEKDAQQLAIIRKLVIDFNVPVEIVEVATVREDDGLAMSSRNRHLTVEERRLAVSLYQSLAAARGMIASGERNTGAIAKAASEMIPRSNLLKLEYLEIVDPVTMQPVEQIDGPVRIAGALWVGSTRLIDNILIGRESPR
jgi:pantoate--beta-alanine ligase